jgi:hypothetical protein
MAVRSLAMDFRGRCGVDDAIGPWCVVVTRAHGTKEETRDERRDDQYPIGACGHLN